MHLQRASAVATGLVALAIASPARAGTFYTSFSAWQTALSSPISIEDVESDILGNYSTPYTTVSKSWQLTAATTPLTISVFGSGLVNGTQELHFRDFTAGVLVAPPGGPVGAFGFDYDTALEPWQVVVGSQTHSLAPHTNGFVGYIGAPLLDFKLVGGAGAQGGISLDNLAVPVPAPGALSLAALAGMAVLRRR